MFIRFDIIHESDRWTDTARQHRPRLCKASRDKNTRAHALSFIHSFIIIIIIIKKVKIIVTLLAFIHSLTHSFSR